MSLAHRAAWFEVIGASSAGNAREKDAEQENRYQSRAGQRDFFLTRGRSRMTSTIARMQTPWLAPVRETNAGEIWSSQPLRQLSCAEGENCLLHKSSPLDMYANDRKARARHLDRFDFVLLVSFHTGPKQAAQNMPSLPAAARIVSMHALAVVKSTGAER